MSLKIENSRPALLWFLFFFALLHVGVNVAIDTWRESHAGVQRNPYYRRGWVEHVRVAPRGNSEHLVIIISNSQGYGREVADDETYASQLESRMQAGHSGPLRVLNWSIPGGDGPEFVVLGAASHRLDPDAVLLLLSPHNLDAAQMKSDDDEPAVARLASDANYLLGFSDVRRHTPGDFTSRWLHSSDFLDIALGRLWRPWRFRELPTAALFPAKSDKATWFYKFKKDVRKKPRTLRTTMNANFDLMNYYLLATQDLRGRVIVAAMPLHSDQRKYYEGFPELLAASVSRFGAEAWDLSAAIPDQHFMTYSHLDREGHSLVAAALDERMRR